MKGAVGRKKKKKPKGDGADPAPPKAPERISRPFADALRGVKVEAEAQPEPLKLEAAAPKKRAPVRAATPKDDDAHSYEDRAAFNVAFADVAPLGAKKAGKKRTAAAPAQRVAPAPAALADESARARLASLVSDGLSFTVRRDAEWVEGQRDDAPKGRLLDLRHGRATPEAEIDLHGMTGDAAVAGLVRFLRQERSRGRTIICVIHGKGLHSSGGVGVLGDRVVDAITSGPAAPHVHAFVTAARDAGGSGALLIRLESR